MAEFVPFFSVLACMTFSDVGVDIQLSIVSFVIKFKKAEMIFFANFGGCYYRKP